MPTSESPFPQSSVPPVPTRKSRAWLGVIFFAFLGLLGMVVLLVGIGFAFEWSAEKSDLSDEQREAMVTLDDVENWYGFTANRDGAEVAVCRRYPDGSIEAEYEYDGGDGNDPYVTTTLSYEPKKHEAALMYRTAHAAVKLGLKLGGEGLVLEASDDWFRWGDRSSLRLIRFEGVTHGLHFIALKDRKVFSVLVSGVLEPTPEDVRRLLTPALDGFEGLKFE